MNSLHFSDDELAALARRAKRHGTTPEVIVQRIVRDQLAVKPLGQAAKWWKHTLEFGGFGGLHYWPEEVTVGSLFADYSRWCDLIGEAPRSKPIGLARNVLSSFLGERRRPCFQGSREYTRTLVPLDQAREKFERIFGVGLQVPDPPAVTPDPAE